MERLRLIDVDVPVLRPGSVAAYALAIGSTVMATVLRLAIDPYVAGIQYVTFFPAVIITTLVGGVGAGLFSLMLSVIAAAFFLLPPIYSVHIEEPADVLNTLMFMLMTLCNVVLIGAVRFAIERYQELSLKLEHHETALREREDRLAIVVAELQHRTRNIIGVVGAIADDTLKTSSSLDDFKTVYHDRIAVLGRAQGLLFRAGESGRVTFDELLDAELAAQCVSSGDQSVSLDGPRGIRLRSSTVQMLAMALHELVTNAVKYGALRLPGGHLTVRWRERASEQSGKPLLHVDWKETGVEMQPSRGGSGHGRELIERALPYQCGAQTTFVLESDGLHCTISLPVHAHGGSAP